MYVVADIGGTKMRVAGSHDLSRFDEPVIVDTPRSYKDGLAAFVDAAKKISGNEAIEGVAAGLTGVLVAHKKSLFKSNIPDWDGRPVAEDIETALQSRVYLENDTALVGLGEAVYGAGKGSSILVYITVSTGVNGVRIVDNHIDRAAIGFEIGEQCLSMGEKPHTLGELISGKAISEKYGKHPRELGKDNPLWEELAEVLAYGLNNTILHWSPNRVVIGGSMMNEIGIPVDRVRVHLKTILTKLPELPEIIHSSLGEVGGLWGGVALLKQAA